ncbi:sensor histidine kinase [Nocardiopsis suaedae]|uniref:Histidine kinase n=1 Tax=Nocardiopsis suaedae TaxID=3018444 RepID=A0ABT4TJ42_9ACTN|nr:histidine kinase [Nocardiopsis suaedae]MDA2804704.1 histidine kinase [Nocardiopsis suaedae]
MRRVPLEAWSGFAMLAVCVAIGVFVVSSPAGLRVPTAAWVLLFTMTIAAVLTTALVEDSRPSLQRATYAAAVVLGWCVLLTAPEAEPLAILLVVIAAFGSSVLPLRAVLGVALVNTAVIGAAWSDRMDDPSSWAFVVGMYLLIHVSAVLSVTAILQEQRMRRELAEAHVELQAAGVLLEESARTAERLRISRDLHDLIGHQLTVLTLELEAARHREGDRAREHVEQAGRVARDLLADVRSTVEALRTDPREGLAASLVRIGADAPGLDVAVEVADGVRPDEEQAEALVRAVKEIVTNTLRHADARELWIDLVLDRGTIRLTAADDGRGAADPRPGNGLTGMRERFEALGGGAAFDGDDGFRVSAWTPVR